MPPTTMIRTTVPAAVFAEEKKDDYADAADIGSQLGSFRIHVEDVTAAAKASKMKSESAGEEKAVDNTEAEDEYVVEEWEEEGQEALWVEEIGANPTTGAVFHKEVANMACTSPIKAGKANIMSSPPPTPNAISGSSALSLTKQNHVLLLPPLRAPASTKVAAAPLLSHEHREREAAEKIATARKLLDESLAVPQQQSAAVNRPLLAQAAFANAVQARQIMEQTPIPEELQAVLRDAVAKGLAEVAKVHALWEHDVSPPRMQIQAPNAAEIVIVDTAEDHISRARDFLECILPEVQMSAVLVSALPSPPAATAASPMAMTGIVLDDISTLGFDNTFSMNSKQATPVADAKALPAQGNATEANNRTRATANNKDFDVLSMSSLNEILDGPMDEDGGVDVMASSSSPSPVAGRHVNKEIVTVMTVSATRATTTSSNPKKRGLLGLWRRSSQKPQQQVNSNNKGQAQLMAVPTTSSNNKALSKTHGPTGASTRSMSFLNRPPKKEGGEVAKSMIKGITVDDGTSTKKQDCLPDADEDIIDVDEREKVQRIKTVDDQLCRALEAAMSGDDGDTISTKEGVKRHGLEQQAHANGGNAVHAAERAVQSKRHGQPPASIKPQFVSAPKGEAALLMQKSWDSLASEGALPREWTEVRDRDDDGAQNVHGNQTREKDVPLVTTAPVEADEQFSLSSPASLVGPSDSPMSTEASDKYQVKNIDNDNVDDDADKYSINACSFEAICNSCAPSSLFQVGAGRSLSSSSKNMTATESPPTAATASSKAAELGSDADEDEGSYNDKYAQGSLEGDEESDDDGETVGDDTTLGSLAEGNGNGTADDPDDLDPPKTLPQQQDRALPGVGATIAAAAATAGVTAVLHGKSAEKAAQQALTTVQGKTEKLAVHETTKVGKGVFGGLFGRRGGGRNHAKRGNKTKNQNGTSNKTKASSQAAARSAVNSVALTARVLSYDPKEDSLDPAKEAVGESPFATKQLEEEIDQLALASLESKPTLATTAASGSTDAAATEHDTSQDENEDDDIEGEEQRQREEQGSEQPEHHPDHQAATDPLVLKIQEQRHRLRTGGRDPVSAAQDMDAVRRGIDP